MNQSKFSLADLLTVLGTLGFGFFCFLSVNFLTLGNTASSLMVAGIIALVLGGLALGIKLLKRSSRNFKTNIIWEYVLLFLYIVVAFISIFPFSHYFSVSMSKSDIQSKVLSNITQSEGLFIDYENYANKRLNFYESRLKSIILAKAVNPAEFKSYGFVEGTEYSTQIDNKIFTLKAQLYPSNYQQMKQIDSAWLSNSKNKVTNWSPTGIVVVVNTLNDEISTWEEQLKTFSSFRAKGETASDWDFVLSFDDVSEKFQNNTKPNLFGIIISISFYLLLLMSYFITKRHPRYPGLKVVFAIGKKKDNQL